MQITKHSIQLMGIQEIRELISNSLPKKFVKGDSLDAEILMLIESRTDFKVFIINNEAFTKEEINEKYPFAELNIEPESIFAQQEIGIFSSTNDSDEFISCDIGDCSIFDEFTMRMKWKLKGTIQTKIFIGKKDWKEFCKVKNFIQGGAKIIASQKNKNAPPIVKALMAISSPPLLRDSDSSNDTTDDFIDNNIAIKNIIERLDSIEKTLAEHKALLEHIMDGIWW